MDAKSRNIICIANFKGKRMTLRCIKDSGAHISAVIETIADKGLQVFRANSTIPVKASKNHKLTAEEKKMNAKNFQTSNLY